MRNFCLSCKEFKLSLAHNELLPEITFHDLFTEQGKLPEHQLFLLSYKLPSSSLKPQGLYLIPSSGCPMYPILPFCLRTANVCGAPICLYVINFGYFL